MKQNRNNERASFSGRLGYVLAAAGASVGLGNIWRFPYLTAKYGGGIFLLVYLILALTFGYTMIVSETAIGRLTKKSPVAAFRMYTKRRLYLAGGWINAIVPVLIVPYYSVIGGWVLKYLSEYLKGNGQMLAQDGYFGSFIADGTDCLIWFAAFAAFTFAVILAGVENGVEGTSRLMMPVLVILAVVTAIYTVTREGALAGVKYMLVPDFSHFSVMTVVAAMGQMFYSLSIAMGILYTYGSYLKDDVDIDASTGQVEIFDTVIALLAAFMIIPAVFAFSSGSTETLQAGPSLMFITLPKVFAATGLCNLIGALFFFLVFFAALTSSIALMEACISVFQDEWKWSRQGGCLFMTAVMAVIGTLSALGYGPLKDFTVLNMQMLDFFDFLTNSVMMPIAALATCFFVLNILTTEKVCEEVERSSPFRRRRIYEFCIRRLAVICILLIFLSSVASAFGWITI